MFKQIHKELTKLKEQFIIDSYIVEFSKETKPPIKIYFTSSSGLETIDPDEENKDLIQFIRTN